MQDDLHIKLCANVTFGMLFDIMSSVLWSDAHAVTTSCYGVTRSRFSDKLL